MINSLQGELGVLKIDEETVCGILSDLSNVFLQVIKHKHTVTFEFDHSGLFDPESITKALRDAKIPYDIFINKGHFNNQSDYVISRHLRITKDLEIKIKERSEEHEYISVRKLMRLTRKASPRKLFREIQQVYEMTVIPSWDNQLKRRKSVKTYQLLNP